MLSASFGVTIETNSVVGRSETTGELLEEEHFGASFIRSGAGYQLDTVVAMTAVCVCGAIGAATVALAPGSEYAAAFSAIKRSTQC